MVNGKKSLFIKLKIQTFIQQTCFELLSGPVSVLSAIDFEMNRKLSAISI